MNQSPLGKLPAELCNLIWELVPHVPEGIHLYVAGGVPEGYTVGFTITHTCRRAKQETADMFFALNHFTIMTDYAHAFEIDGRTRIPQVKEKAVADAVAEMLKDIDHDRVNFMQGLLFNLEGSKNVFTREEFSRFWEYANDRYWGMFRDRRPIVPRQDFRVHMRLQTYRPAHLDIPATAGTMQYSVPWYEKATLRLNHCIVPVWNILSYDQVHCTVLMETWWSCQDRFYEDA
ncbi:hypothetical protein LTR78_000393 [Recurvomyces mirabilis]|uniref:Uncharacterized protein n=1 Tax=Recurvomyces mirabilis TaxID=574656 RepID=A0AAE1C6J0_9PEZI|nr:hypothetical protein LTR78_000393 [Recurvomyces mirabilis]KAK5162048.1 hypothetical protein LTS14_000394 [Recurvomyces mirabilis]